MKPNARIAVYLRPDQWSAVLNCLKFADPENRLGACGEHGVFAANMTHAHLAAIEARIRERFSEFA